MDIKDRVITRTARAISKFSLKTNLGAGATWPGEFALRLNPDIGFDLGNEFKKGIILIAGTNGKTTTTLMLKDIFESQGDRVIYNPTGANLLNGIISALILAADNTGKINADWGIFEVDENSLPQVIKSTKPTAVVLLNLFRIN